MLPPKADGRSRSFPYPTRQVQTTVGELAYFDTGAGSASATGDPLIFVHGLVGDFTHFEHVAPAFAPRHRVLGVDMPGCGLSCRPDRRHTVPSYGAAVLALMAALRIPRATLVGHSAGGQVCAEAAALDSSRVTRLVMINPSGLRGYPLPLRWLARALFQPALLTAVLEPAAVPILDQVFHRRNFYTEKFIADSLDRPRHPVLYEMAKVFHDLTPDLLTPSIVRHAPSLVMPSLIIMGERDRLIPIATVANVARTLPRGDFRVIEACGHMPIIENPEATVDLITAFVSAELQERAAA